MASTINKVLDISCYALCRRLHFAAIVMSICYAMFHYCSYCLKCTEIYLLRIKCVHMSVV